MIDPPPDPSPGPPPILHLVDGRSVTYRLYGQGGGRPVIALHGTPGSHLKFATASATAANLGLRLIAIDRWGYAGTDAPSNPRLSDYAADVAAVADALGIDRFAVMGISGGGPFAAAIAAGLGSRVTALALVAPVGPIAGVSPKPVLRLMHRFTFEGLPKVPGAIAGTFRLLALISRRNPALAGRLTAFFGRESDREIMRDAEIATNLGTSFAVGLDRGASGPSTDVALFAKPWGVDLAAITAPTRIWIGDADRNVPIAAVEALASAISHGSASVQVTRLEGHGHFWIARHHREVLAWLARPA